MSEPDYFSISTAAHNIVTLAARHAEAAEAYEAAKAPGNPAEFAERMNAAYTRNHAATTLNGALIIWAGLCGIPADEDALAYAHQVADQERPVHAHVLPF